MTEDPNELSLAQNIDSICDRFESEFRAQKQPQIEDYLDGWQEPARSALLRALVGLEAELRHKQGQTPKLQEYAARFPQQTSEVRQAFADLRSAISSIKTAAAETAVVKAGQPAAQASSVLTTLGRFQMRNVLGEGAFGTVYRAHDPQLDREVAIKVPRSGSLPTEEDRQRFLREARASAALQHPAICPVYEAGTAEGRDFIVMAFIDGKPLSKVMQAAQRLPERQVVAAIRKIALALQEAHDKGVIHRDLKPANVMINRKGEPVVMDFGLARRANAGDAQISHSGQIMGTPAYMSPEQARGDGKGVGPASDLYSLGVIFYEMLCGRRPFEGTITEVIGKILQVEIEPPTKYRPDLDPRLEAICLKAVAKNPDDRYGSMKTFAAELGEYLKSAIASNAGPTKTAKDDADGTRQFANLVEAVSTDLESKLERAAQQAIQAQRPAAWWSMAICAGLVGGMILLGIVFLIRKETVTVIVNIPEIDPKDPTLTFRLDRIPVPAAMFLAPINLKPGPHELIVNKDGKLFKRFVFDVGKENREPVVVRDVSPPSAGPPGDEPPPAVAPFTAEQARQFQEAWAKYLQQPVQFENRVGIKLRLIPPGSFTMGSNGQEVEQWISRAKADWEKGPIRTEAPARTVIIEAPFYLADCETHVAAFREFVKATGYSTEAEANGKGGRKDGPGGKADQKPEYSWQHREFAISDRHPVVQVTRKDADAFCAWLSEQEGRRYFVPHEEQWEYACRAGTITPWWHGEDESAFADIAWTGTNTLKVQPVGLKPPNPFGLCDMLSNVQEICRCSEGYCVRGGRLWNSPISCRSASRAPYWGDSWVYTGFRIAAAANNEASTQEGSESAKNARSSPDTPSQAAEYQQACAASLAVPVETTNSIGMEFCLIPPGIFREGLSDAEQEALLRLEPSIKAENLSGERPAHYVRLSNPFYLGKYEVTVGQFREFISATGYVSRTEQLARSSADGKPLGHTWNKVPWPQSDRHPVAFVTWNDARAFVQWLTKKEGKQYRLPTCAEWEYACRAGTQTLWYSGNDLEGLVKIANVADATAKAKLASAWPNQVYIQASDGFVDPAPVGRFLANAFGLYDTLGNVWEWCSDWQADNPYKGLAARIVSDPQGPSTGKYRVRRGGSWIHGIRYGHAATRLSDDPNIVHSPNYGFRVALAVEGHFSPAVSQPGVEIRELNITGFESAPWPSTDGARLYFESRKPPNEKQPGPWLYVSRRSDSDAKFAGREPLFPGRMPTLTGDELELIFARGQKNAFTLHVAKRASTRETFTLAGEILELRGQGNAVFPTLSENGLTLLFERGLEQSAEIEFLICTRPDRKSPWSIPVPLPIAKDPPQAKPLSSPILSRDGLTLWYSYGDRTTPEIRIATRPDRNSEFRNHQPVVIDGRPLIGRFPRFVPATNELFYAANLSGNPLDWSLFMIRDFSEAATNAGDR